MIARTWSGRTTPAKQDAYIAHFTMTVLPELRKLDGFIAASLLRQERGHDVRILVITTWKSTDAILAFAGEEIERAVVEPEAVNALTSFDATVEHWDVLSPAGTAAGRPTQGR